MATIAFCSSRASLSIACARRAKVRSATTVWVVLVSQPDQKGHHNSSTGATPNVYRISDMLTRRCSHVRTLRLDHHAALHPARKNGHLGVGRIGTAEAQPVPKREGALGA